MKNLENREACILVYEAPIQGSLVIFQIPAVYIKERGAFRTTGGQDITLGDPKIQAVHEMLPGEQVWPETH